MIKKLAALLLFLHFSVAYSQTIKTDVLVIGGTPSGVAAAIQCARSKVKTVLIDSSSQLCSNLSSNVMTTIYTDRNLPSGIWGEFQKRIRKHYKDVASYDSTHNSPLQLEPYIGRTILTEIADTIKNLTVNLNTGFTTAVKEPSGWQVTIVQNGKSRTVKTRIIIDATENGSFSNEVYARYYLVDNNESTKGLTEYRTSIAMGDELPAINHIEERVKNNYPQYPAYYIPIDAIVARGTDNVDNLLITENLLPAKRDIQYLPVELTLGQGAGVTAAYCAFFKTTTANLNIRAIQVELLDFKGYLLPFTDISADPYWRAIQQVCATGMLKGKQKMVESKQQFLFMPDSIVVTAEVKPILTEIYTRAFLWFNVAKPGKEFTVGNLLSFISELTLTDPDNLQRKIEKEWSAQYKFKSAFDMERPITRREFAILANKYLNPFARAVDMDGRIVN